MKIEIKSFDFHGVKYVDGEAVGPGVGVAGGADRTVTGAATRPA
jgi:hypothetical protein